MGNKSLQDIDENKVKIEGKGFKALINYKRLLYFEKILFIFSAGIAEFLMFIKFGIVQWIANENILLFIAVPAAISGIFVRRYRKRNFKPDNNANKKAPAN